MTSDESLPSLNLSFLTSQGDGSMGACSRWTQFSLKEDTGEDFLKERKGHSRNLREDRDLARGRGKRSVSGRKNSMCKSSEVRQCGTFKEKPVQRRNRASGVQWGQFPRKKQERC